MQADLDFLEMVTRDKFIPVAKDNVYDMNRIFKIMQPRIKEATGTSLSWNSVAHRNQTVGRFAGYSFVSNQSNNPLERLALNPAQYAGAISFAYDELIKNSGNKEKLADLAEAQTKNLEDTMLELVGIDMYSDGSLVDGLQGIVGLAAAIDVNNTYAGINRSTTGNEFWQANQNSTSYSTGDMENPVAAGYLPKVMQDMYSAASHKKAPDFIVSHEDVYNIYANIARVQNLRIGPGKADLGFPTLEFSGATYLFDKYCPAYTMYMLTTSGWDIYVYPQANFSFVKTKDGNIWIPNQNQLGQTAFVIWMGQLRCETPREQAGLTGLGNG